MVETAIFYPEQSSAVHESDLLVLRRFESVIREKTIRQFGRTSPVAWNLDSSPDSERYFKLVLRADGGEFEIMSESSRALELMSVEDFASRFLKASHRFGRESSQQSQSKNRVR